MCYMVKVGQLLKNEGTKMLFTGTDIKMSIKFHSSQKEGARVKLPVCLPQNKFTLANPPHEPQLTAESDSKKY